MTANRPGEGTSAATGLPWLACDRCTVGVMDSTNPHLLGTCSCACHKDPTQRVEATTTPEGREGWDEPRHPEAGEAMASLPPLRAGADAIPEGVRAETRDEQHGDSGDPGSAATAAIERDADLIAAQVADASVALLEHDDKCREFRCLMRDGCDERVRLMEALNELTNDYAEARKHA